MYVEPGHDDKTQLSQTSQSHLFRSHGSAPEHTGTGHRIPRLHSEIHTGNLKNEEVLLFGMTKMASRESGTKRLAVDLSTQADSELAQAQTRFSLLPSVLNGTLGKGTEVGHGPQDEWVVNAMQRKCEAQTNISGHLNTSRYIKQVS